MNPNRLLSPWPHSSLHHYFLWASYLLHLGTLSSIILCDQPKLHHLQDVMDLWTQLFLSLSYYVSSNPPHTFSVHHLTLGGLLFTCTNMSSHFWYCPSFWHVMGSLPFLNLCWSISSFFDFFLLFNVHPPRPNLKVSLWKTCFLVTPAGMDFSLLCFLYFTPVVAFDVLSLWYLSLFFSLLLNQGWYLPFSECLVASYRKKSTYFHVRQPWILMSALQQVFKSLRLFFLHNLSVSIFLFLKWEESVIQRAVLRITWTNVGGESIVSTL